MTEHQIAPPLVLVQQWLGEFFGCVVNGEISDSERYLTAKAAAWGYQRRCLEELSELGQEMQADD